MIDLAEKVEREHQNEIERTKPRTRKDWMMMGWTCMTIAYLSPYFLKRLYPEHIPDLGIYTNRDLFWGYIKWSTAAILAGGVMPELDRAGDWLVDEATNLINKGGKGISYISKRFSRK